MKSKVETTMYVQKVIADINDIGRPHCYRTGNGGEFTSRSYVDYCDTAGIRRGYIAPGKPQQNMVVESAFWRAMKGGHAARREIRQPFPAVDYARNPNTGANGKRLWLEAVLWAAGGFNRSATKANTGLRSPDGAFFARLPSLHMVPSSQEGMTQVNRGTKFDVTSVPCYYLNIGSNHPSSAITALKASTGSVCYTCDIVWMNSPRARNAGAGREGGLQCAPPRRQHHRGLP